MSERPIRVAYFIDKLPRAGAQLSLARLAAGLDPARFLPQVLCLAGGGAVADMLRERGIPVECLELGRLYGPRAAASLPRIARHLRSAGVDVVQTYLASANIYGTFAARLAGVRVVITTRRDTGFSRNWRLRLLEEWLVNGRVDRVVAVSPTVADCARRERHLSGDRVVTIENGVDLTVWDPGRYGREELRREWGFGADEPLVGVVARLSPVKGHGDLLRAAARVVPRARFLLVGDGPLRGELETLARSLGIADRVVFTGARQDVPSVLAMLDMVVVSSLTEGLSNALLEAMAMALPVVATAAGGNPDLVGDRVTGLLVPVRDPEALAGALLQLLDDRERARAMGRAARQRVQEDFSLQRMVARYQALYTRLASKSRD